VINHKSYVDCSWIEPSEPKTVQSPPFSKQGQRQSQKQVTPATAR